MKLDELAKLAGVSRTTVSYVVNGKAKEYRVSDKTIEKVSALIKQYNFKPNAMAAGLRVGRTNTIGLIIPDFENMSYARIANHLENRCRERGYQLIIACSNDNPENEMNCATNLFQRRVEALIVSTSLPVDSTFYQENCGETPLIYFDRRSNSEQGMKVLSDDENDAYLLAEKLFSVQDNIKNVLFLGAVADLDMSHHRQQGFERSAARHNVNVEYLYANRFHKYEATEAFVDWLQNNPLPDAIFVTSLTLMQGVFAALLKVFKHIPEDMVIATFGNHEMLDLVPNKVVCSVQHHDKIVEALLRSVEFKLKRKKLQYDQEEVIPRQILCNNCE
ncbi:catabolite repressor/activator [Conservatibacter flavescens]|uniref:Catabolite repressor/activator n=1 Tax=Conservatibacter flavescens TaxID=28161 RepID=A0A2M8S619_9PAST|nr:catabolite repressor/activator [Conservatibacter flavescens]PJG86551.1 catabolite repressor/activator [Conservatibacter flavescens]